jgi:hypothetical protein
MAELDTCVKSLESIDLRAKVSPREAEVQLVASRMAIDCSKVVFKQLCEEMNERASQLSAVQKELLEDQREVLEDKKRLEKAWEDFHRNLERGQEQTGLREFVREDLKRMLEQQRAEVMALMEKKLSTRIGAGGLGDE